MLGDALVRQRMPRIASSRPAAVETARRGQFFGEQLHEPQKIAAGRRVEPQFRLELERLVERVAEMRGAMLLDHAALEANADLRIAGMPAHVQRQGRRHQRCGKRR